MLKNKKQAAVFTIVKNEKFFIPIWLNYYKKHLPFNYYKKHLPFLLDIDSSFVGI